MERRESALVAAVLLGITAAADAGCYSPIPSCSSTDGADRSISVSSARYQPESGASFRLDGVFYASCMDLCATQPDVRSVESCRPPAPSELHPDGTHTWTIECRAQIEDCHNGVIIGGIGGGRRPEGFAPRREPAPSVGEWLAELARVEAASVPAFDRLARELAWHDAPSALVDAARAAQVDEVRHARIVATLARRYGADVAPVDLRPTPIRPLAEVIAENAAEGCIAETLGAILARFQARRACDLRIRRAMAHVARDESRHAALAWRVLAFGMSRLPAADRRRVEDRLRAAAAALVAEDATHERVDVRGPLGLPNRAEASALLAATRARFV